MPKLTEMDEGADARSWRRWFTISVAQLVFAGYFLMAYGIGSIVRATRTLDVSVRQQTINADAASQRLEHQTRSLIKLTRRLAAATVLLLIATVVILVVAILPILGVVATAASSARLSFGDDAWTWAERVASIITIVGLGILYFQVSQLIRRPKLQIGFPHDPDPNAKGVRLMQVVNATEIEAHWNPGEDLSQPVRLAVNVQNDVSASGTAQDVNFEVRYPLWLEPVGEHDLKRPPEMNLWSHSKQNLVLNPGAGTWLRGTFRIPRGRNRIQVNAQASMRDHKPIDKMLEIRVKEV